jgi:hypothetical protein
MSDQKPTPTVEDFGIPDLPLPPDECPISALLGKRPADMTDAELEEYTKKLRLATDSPQSLKKMLLRKGAKPKKSSKVDMSLLGDL